MICSRCGTRNSDENTFCSFCGSRLVIPQPVAEPTPEFVPSVQNIKSKMCLDAMKKHFGSKLFLSVVIVFGIILLLSALLSVLPIIIDSVISDFVNPPMLWGTIVSTLFAVLPLLIMFIGYVKIYNAASKGAALPLDTSGHRLVCGVLTFYSILMYIFLAMIAVIPILCFFIPSEAIAANTLDVLSAITLRIIIIVCAVLVAAVPILGIIYFSKLKKDFKNLAKCFESGTPFKGLSLYVTVFDLLEVISMLSTLPIIFVAIGAASIIQVPEVAGMIPSLIFSMIVSAPALYAGIANLIIRFGVNKDLNAINSIK